MDSNHLIMEMVYVGSADTIHHIGTEFSSMVGVWVPGKVYTIEIPNGKTLSEYTLKQDLLSCYVIDDGHRMAVNGMQLYKYFKSVAEIRNDKINEILTKSESVNTLLNK